MGNFFWCRAIKRANKETCHFLGIGNLKRLTRSGILAAIAVLVIKFIGVTGQMNEEWRWTLAVIVAAIIFYVPMFFWNLVKAPGRMEVDVQTQNKHDNAEINAKLNEVQQRNQILEEERNPKFVVKPVVRQHQEYENNEMTAWAELEIKNTSPIVELVDVRVQIVEMRLVSKYENYAGLDAGIYYTHEPNPRWSPANVYWSGITSVSGQYNYPIHPSETQCATVAFHHKNGTGLGVFNTRTHPPMLESKIIIEVSGTGTNAWRGIYYIAYYPPATDKFDFVEWDLWCKTHKVIERSIPDKGDSQT